DPGLAIRKDTVPIGCQQQIKAWVLLFHQAGTRAAQKLRCPLDDLWLEFLIRENIECPARAEHGNDEGSLVLRQIGRGIEQMLQKRLLRPIVALDFENGEANRHGNW